MPDCVHNQVHGKYFSNRFTSIMHTGFSSSLPLAAASRLCHANSMCGCQACADGPVFSHVAGLRSRRQPSSTILCFELNFEIMYS